jgi:hypothetical protein
MKNSKLRLLVACLLLAATLLSFAACKKEEALPPVPTISREELIPIIIDAKIKNNDFILLSNSFIDYNQVFEDVTKASKKDPAEVYRTLTVECGKTISSYLDYREFKNADDKANKIVFGADYKVEYEIINTYEYVAEDIEVYKADIKEKLQNMGLSADKYFDPSKVTEICEIEFNYTVEGMMNKKEDRGFIILCKYDGVWRYAEVAGV